MDGQLGRKAADAARTLREELLADGALGEHLQQLADGQPTLRVRRHQGDASLRNAEGGVNGGVKACVAT